MNNEKPTVNIVELKRAVEGEKRQAIPFAIEWKCPTCGTKWKDELVDVNYYLSYPKFVSPNKKRSRSRNDLTAYNLYCEICSVNAKKCEWTIKLRITISAELVEIE